MASVPSGVERLSKISVAWVGRTNFTDRQTTDDPTTTDEHRAFSNRMSALSKFCYYHIHELRCLCAYVDFKTASTIATSIVHCKLDYCNSLYTIISQSQIKNLQHIQNSLARAVTGRLQSSHITFVLKSLHWLKINERIKFSNSYGFHNPPTSISRRLDFCSTLSQHTFFFYGHSCSLIYPLLFENHKSLF